MYYVKKFVTMLVLSVIGFSTGWFVGYATSDIPKEEIKTTHSRYLFEENERYRYERNEFGSCSRVSKLDASESAVEVDCDKIKTKGDE